MKQLYKNIRRISIKHDVFQGCDLGHECLPALVNGCPMTCVEPCPPGVTRCPGGTASNGCPLMGFCPVGGTECPAPFMNPEGQSASNDATAQAAKLIVDDYVVS